MTLYQTKECCVRGVSVSVYCKSDGTSYIFSTLSSSSFPLIVLPPSSQLSPQTSHFASLSSYLLSLILHHLPLATLFSFSLPSFLSPILVSFLSFHSFLSSPFTHTFRRVKLYGAINPYLTSYNSYYYYYYLFIYFYFLFFIFIFLLLLLLLFLLLLLLLYHYCYYYHYYYYHHYQYHHHLFLIKTKSCSIFMYLYIIQIFLNKVCVCVCVCVCVSVSVCALKK